MEEACEDYCNNAMVTTEDTKWLKELSAMVYATYDPSYSDPGFGQNSNSASEQQMPQHSSIYDPMSQQQTPVHATIYTAASSGRLRRSTKLGSAEKSERKREKLMKNVKLVVRSLSTTSSSRRRKVCLDRSSEVRTDQRR
jgi:hypothetical protein